MTRGRRALALGRSGQSARPDALPTTVVALARMIYERFCATANPLLRQASGRQARPSDP